MKRDIYQKLLAWKSSSRRKPLILKGAFKVRKTYIIKAFGKNEYDKLAYLDLTLRRLTGVENNHFCTVYCTYQTCQ